jgi:predicted lipid-binding transport protein (Tim44 family)
MDGNILTLIFLVLAVVIILKLRSVLGRRTGEDDARIERHKAEMRAREAQRQAAQDKVVALPRRDRQDAPTPPVQTAAPLEDIEAKVRGWANGDPALADGLLAIHTADRSFDPESFMKGARAAYEMIVTAFAEGNRKTLKPLLSREVFDGFQAVIADRESRGELIEHGFVGINKSDIIEAELKRNMAHVTVKFVSDLISATRDKAGNVLAGDPNKIKEVIDIWTFARDVDSRDPNWKLVATQAPN